MADQVYEFDNDAVAAALEAARAHYADKADAMAESVTEDGHLAMAAGCISVTVENGKVCINLPLGFGKYCFPIPSIIPNGTAAEACLHICTTWGIPTGVKVTISVAGKVIVSKSFGKC
ncbi:hypothetical protein GCM10007385_36610 [Tateyamaria omphalii]|uniref:hypothetical protein n=1 Tax=Tateyamaria omphalii TaxID=299262 RepID=UPI00167A4843|nr:hypothetical protein [Tateyamaria omphalii]GGX64075.1 hypothetical protein GCM10007385_36610 [Tateyamaria omphalii]